MWDSSRHHWVSERLARFHHEVLTVARPLRGKHRKHDSPLPGDLQFGYEGATIESRLHPITNEHDLPDRVQDVSLSQVS